ncbi:MAG: helix-turn-helix domain-containing protein [Deltaproteobacteria bacterium]|nr:helix-turn-helix domain-containing protein [Deltaproteobacteria bacterium]
MLTLREVAKALRVSTATVYRMVGAGALEHFRVLNAIRVPALAIERLAEAKASDNEEPN